ncbi:MAG: DUF47 domain-containing protein [Promethearchaeota archaeon]
MGSLIEFLKRETIVNALEKSVQHAQIVQECVRKLNSGIIALIKETDLDKAHDFFTEVDHLEDKADDLRRNILNEISRRELNPSARQNLSHLIKRMDDVANCCTGVARRINTLPMKFWEQSSDKTVKLVLDMMENTVDCAQFLDKIVLDLIENRKKVKDYVSKINELEHKVDLLNIKLRKSLQETNYEVNFFTAFTAGNVFDIIEAISDAIENVADYISILLISDQ